MPGLPRLDLAATEGKGAGLGGRATVRHLRECLSLSLCVCARACACAQVYVTCTHSFSHIRVCVCVLVDDGLYCKAAPLSVCCVQVAVLGEVGGDLALGAHEWLLLRLGAVTT